MNMENTGLKSVGRIDRIIEDFEETLEVMYLDGIAPNQKKVFERYFSAYQVADMVGKSRGTIVNLINELGIEQDKTKGGRSRGLSLSQINQIRDHIGIRPIRAAGDKVPRIAIQNFKGGTAKSTTTIHFAQYLALKGYRVLIHDCDPQSTVTACCGFIPDKDFNQDDTMYSVIRGEKEAKDIIVNTYFPGIDLIPSCLAAYETEYSLFFGIAEADATNNHDEKISYYYELDQLISEVEDNYDVVLFDSPPALSIMSLNILCAATGIFVPVPPMLYDYLSTGQYFKMISRMLKGIAADKEFDFVKILATKVDRGKPKQVDFVDTLRDTFGNDIVSHVMVATANIPNAAATFSSSYEMTGRDKDKEVIKMLDTVFGEMEIDILKTLASKAPVLAKRGVI